MRGDRHYVAAEKALEVARTIEGDPDETAYWHRAAQVHATLALVAALHDRETGTQGQRHAPEWRAATSAPGSGPDRGDGS